MVVVEEVEGVSEVHHDRHYRDVHTLDMKE